MVTATGKSVIAVSMSGRARATLAIAGSAETDSWAEGALGHDLPGFSATQSHAEGWLGVGPVTGHSATPTHASGTMRGFVFNATQLSSTRGVRAAVSMNTVSAGVTVSVDTSKTVQVAGGRKA